MYIVDVNYYMSTNIYMFVYVIKYMYTIYNVYCIMQKCMSTRMNNFRIRDYMYVEVKKYMSKMYIIEVYVYCRRVLLHVYKYIYVCIRD